MKLLLVILLSWISVNIIFVVLSWLKSKNNEIEENYIDSEWD